MNKMKKWTIGGFLFTSVVGTLLHFAFEKLGTPFWAVIGAVNESTWEHLKLLFWPFFIFTIIEYFVYGNNISGFLFSKAISVIIGMASNVILFYTYSGVLGFNVTAIDISLFFIAVILSYFISYKLNSHTVSYFSAFNSNLAGAVIFLIIAVLFIIFTFKTPRLGLFLDPVSGKYGI